LQYSATSSSLAPLARNASGETPHAVNTIVAANHRDSTGSGRDRGGGYCCESKEEKILGVKN
jgi:hypothetical protein